MTQLLTNPPTDDAYQYNHPDQALGYLPVLNTGPNPSQAIRALFYGPFISGHNRRIRHAGLNCSQHQLDSDPIPPHLVVQDVRGANSRETIVQNLTFTALIEQGPRRASVVVRAATQSYADQGLEEISSWFPELPEENRDKVPVDFWQAGARMSVTQRSIQAPTWDTVAHHYPGEVRGDLDRLMTMSLDEPPGRVILWHGPPGTGKTSAIRALAQSWRDSARVQVVLEPEQVFKSSAGLMQVLLADRDNDDEVWRILVVEDADDLVRAGTHNGSVLSRLLNVGDGLVGQGLRILVMLTTNEPPQRLHPALSRPGRCLSSIAFRSFTAAEASASFPEMDLASAGDCTLAEIMNHAVETEAAASAGSGAYL